MFSWIILERFPPTKPNRLQHAGNGYWGFAPLTTSMRLSFAQMRHNPKMKECRLSTLKRDHFIRKLYIYSNHQLFRGHVGFQGGASTVSFVLNMLHILTTDLGVFQCVTNLTWNKMFFMITLLKYLEICVLQRVQDIYDVVLTHPDRWKMDWKWMYLKLLYFPSSHPRCSSRNLGKLFFLFNCVLSTRM